METENICQKYNVLNTFLDSSNNSLTVIKSNLMLRVKMLTEKQGLEIDTGPMCCKWCFNSWLPGKYSVVLKPQKHPKKHMRSLLKKDINTLNKFQHKLVTKIKKSATKNILVLKCLVCSKNTLLPLQKEYMNMIDKAKSRTTESVGLQVVQKKKRKKKDLFAGLNVQALQKYKKSTENQTIKKCKPANRFPKKAIKEISLRQQLHIHKALIGTPVPKKSKPSQLAAFLENM